MPKDKRTKKFALRLRMVNRKTVEAEKKDAKTKAQEKLKREREKAARDDPDSNLLEVEQATKPSTALFFSYNMSLGPPYQIILDTNFISLSIQNKIDIFDGLMDCLYAKCIPIITDCVMGLSHPFSPPLPFWVCFMMVVAQTAELEKLGTKFRVALRIARDPRFKRLTCTHQGTYADDCIVERVTAAKCYIVATCDRDLKRRIRKIPGVPIMYIAGHRFTVERMPDAVGNLPRT